MFCRNCAEVLLDTDITCPKCGFAAGTGNKYCASCGSETPGNTVVCEICGQPVNNNFGGNMQFQQQPHGTDAQHHLLHTGVCHEQRRDGVWGAEEFHHQLQHGESRDHGHLHD